MTLTQHILAIKAAHPDWTSAQVGQVAHCRSEYVRAVYKRYSLQGRPSKPEDEETGDPRVTRSALVERRKRQDALAQRDLTATLMGDPPPRP